MTLESIILAVAGILANTLLGILIYEIRKLREETGKRVTIKEFRIQMASTMQWLHRVETRVNEHDREIAHVRGILSIGKRRQHPEPHQGK